MMGQAGTLQARVVQLNEKALKLKEVATELGCNIKTVQAAIDRGELKTNRFGPKTIRVMRSELDRFIKSTVKE